MKETYRDDLIIIDDKELYPVPNHPFYYADLEEGKVFNSVTEKWMNSKGSTRTQYVYITLKDKHGNQSPISEHWAVYSALTGIEKGEFIKKGLTLHHISGVKNDNKASNLQLVRFKDQFIDARTKDKIKKRNGNRLTRLQKESLVEAWESLENPKRSKFVNEWLEKMDVSWRTIDNFVVNNLINK